MHAFSICIPTHRIDKRLSNSLRSLTYLRYPRELIEICLLVNNVDRTTPDLLNILGGVDRFEIHAEALGPSRAKNEALGLATNTWAILLDSDDFLVPSALEQYSAAIDENDSMVLGCEWSMFNLINGNLCFPDTEENYRDFHKALLGSVTENGAFGRPIIFNTRHLVPYSSKYSLAEERKLVVDYIRAGYTVNMLGTCSYIYNWNDAGISRDSNRALRDRPEFQETIREIVADIPREILVRDTDKFMIPGPEDILAAQMFLEWELDGGSES